MPRLNKLEWLDFSSAGYSAYEAEKGTFLCVKVRSGESKFSLCRDCKELTAISGEDGSLMEFVLFPMAISKAIKEVAKDYVSDS